MGKRNKNLYNYFVNTFGLSKDAIMAVINERVEDLLSKHIQNKLNSNSMETLIANMVTRFLEEGVTNHSWWMKKTSFEDFLKKTISQEIKDRLNDEYTLEVKLVRKEDSVINKV
jgi:uncharacterized membrane protein YheB (UPF0754 family)